MASTRSGGDNGLIKACDITDPYVTATDGDIRTECTDTRRHTRWRPVVRSADRRARDPTSGRPDPGVQPSPSDAATVRFGPSVRRETASAGLSPDGPTVGRGGDTPFNSSMERPTVLYGSYKYFYAEAA